LIVSIALSPSTDQPIWNFEGLARSGGSDAQFLAIRDPAGQRGNPAPPVQPLHPAGVPAAGAPQQ
jgi:hypothetical protein